MSTSTFCLANERSGEQIILVDAGLGSRFPGFPRAGQFPSPSRSPRHRSRIGDRRHLRGLLYEAATVLLTRSRSECDLRKWGLQLRERLGLKRAAVAVARKLAVIMHSMLTTGEPFRGALATA